MGNEINELMDRLCDATRLVSKEVGDIVAKGNLTPSELECLYKAACMAEKITRMSNEMPSMDMSYGQYHMGYPQMNYGRNNYTARSPVTGRYISRGTEQSGHSIVDRMIASLEEQMDSAKTDYERQLIQEEIENIRAKNR